MIPKKLKDFTGFLDGLSYLGKAKEITLPKLTEKTEEYRPGGFDAPIEIAMGMEKLETSVNWEEYDKALIKLFGQAGKAIVWRGSIEADDGSTEAVIVTMRGRSKELDFGNWKAGDDTSLKQTFPLTYYKYEQGGETLIEIDAENSVRIVGGVDQLAERRRNLGI